MDQDKNPQTPELVDAAVVSAAVDQLLDPNYSSSNWIGGWVGDSPEARSTLVGVLQDTPVSPLGKPQRMVVRDRALGLIDDPSADPDILRLMKDRTEHLRDMYWLDEVDKVMFQPFKHNANKLFSHVQNVGGVWIRNSVVHTNGYQNFVYEFFEEEPTEGSFPVRMYNVQIGFKGLEGGDYLCGYLRPIWYRDESTDLHTEYEMLSEIPEEDRELVKQQTRSLVEESLVQQLQEDINSVEFGEGMVGFQSLVLRAIHRAKGDPVRFRNELQESGIEDPVPQWFIDRFVV